MKKKGESVPSKSELILYRAEDGKIKVDVLLQDETVWLTIGQMAELFQIDKTGISRHLANIFETGELQSKATVAKIATVQREGRRIVRRDIEYYNLDAIISVGYRVNSIRGTQFRVWATQRIREYIVKGFAMDDERLKRIGGGHYFDELLARIRDIRSSEKVFWRKVLDIYATSVDYDPDIDLSRRFFAAVQNKMHWAAHGHTAAEIIHGRADAAKPNMGMTAWSGSMPMKSDAEIAKNYLNEKELDMLNRLVTMYLEFAEIQALSRNPMYMRDWIEKLDDFLKLSGRDILKHAGAISHDKALGKAHAEYERYRKDRMNAPSPVEQRFLESVKDIERIEGERRRKRKDDRR